MKGPPLLSSVTTPEPVFRIKIKRRKSLFQESASISAICGRIIPGWRRFLAFAVAEVIQLGATGASLFFHFHFRNPWRMHRKNALHPFAIGNATT